MGSHLNGLPLVLPAWSFGGGAGVRGARLTLYQPDLGREGKRWAPNQPDLGRGGGLEGKGQG